MFTYIFIVAFTIALYNAILYIIPTNEYGRLVEIEGVSKKSEAIQKTSNLMKTYGSLAQLYGSIAVISLFLM